MNNTAKWIVCFFLLFVLSGFSIWAQEDGKAKQPEEGAKNIAEEPESAETAIAPSEDLAAEKKEGPVFDWKFEGGIGARTFNENDEQITYQSLTLAPEFFIGRFGFGLYVNINFRFTGGENGDEFYIREEDWVLDSPSDFLPTYLPKIKFISWDEKGAPLYVRLGQIEQGTLGNGFIMANYTNTLFLPELPIFGLSFDFDGLLFNFPYVGFETFAGNLSIFDVQGARLYVRPLAWLKNQDSIFRGLTLGTTVAGDRHPFYHIPGEDIDGDGHKEEATPLFIIGGDFRLPLIVGENFVLSTYGDVVFQDYARGGMIGLGGNIAEIVPFRADIRFIGPGFIPVYFDATYDVYRVQKYLLFSPSDPTPAYVGWNIQTGLNLLQERIIFSFAIDGPFGQPAPVTVNGVAPEDNFQNYPHVRMVLKTTEKLFPIFLEASYDKILIREFGDFFTGENTTLNASLNFKLGPATISVDYKLRPKFSVDGESAWETVSGIESLISLF